ncbi:MAG TPA: hypothetical protein VNT99_02330 [Methylomirabilota bacterium]|nr:hypothetical protein [Methylomirabilota bacterium]
MSRRGLLILGVGIALVAVAVATLPLLARSSNCGGNSAALNQVRHYAILAELCALNNSNGAFRVADVPDEERNQLRQSSRNHWIPGARFLVSTNTVTTSDFKARHILIVCDKPYRNVPRRWIGTAPPAHAVAYSDGSAALMSPAEFASMDRRSFVFLDELYPSN